MALVHVYFPLSALNEQQTNLFMFFTLMSLKLEKCENSDLQVYGGALPFLPSPLYALEFVFVFFNKQVNFPV